MTQHDLFTVFSVLLGASVGSFLNVCIYRIPLEGVSISQPRGSYCPTCQAQIRWFDNIPILAWIFLSGKCRSCQSPISFRYPVVELVSAILFFMIWLQFGPDDGSVATSLASWGDVLFWWLIFSGMIVVSMIDFDHRIIPDEISVTGGALVLLVIPFLDSVPLQRSGIPQLANYLEPLDHQIASGAALAIQGALALTLGGLAMAGMRRWSPDWEGKQRGWWCTRWAGAVGAALGISLGGIICRPDWLQSNSGQALLAALIGSAIGAGTLYGIGVVGKLVFRREAMGFGDVKLMGLLGAILGPRDVLLAVFLASFLGSIVGIPLRLLARSKTIPFGPFLCAAAAILVLASSQVETAILWYFQQIGTS